jgi:hypothetical protein
VSGAGEVTVQFRLTYEGELLSHRDDGPTKARAPHKHAIRRRFHKQLRNLFSVHPALDHYTKPERNHIDQRNVVERWADNWNRFGYRFAPIVTRNNGLICKVSVLLMRPGRPGAVISAGDIDNRLKTLIDALKMPGSAAEIPGDKQPDEDPFFVLLEDDSLITQASVETDTLLEPVVGDAVRTNDVRVVISCAVHPYRVTVDNLDYGY